MGVSGLGSLPSPEQAWKPIWPMQLHVSLGEFRFRACPRVNFYCRFPDK